MAFAKFLQPRRILAWRIRGRFISARCVRHRDLKTATKKMASILHKQPIGGTGKEWH